MLNTTRFRGKMLALLNSRVMSPGVLQCARFAVAYHDRRDSSAAAFTYQYVCNVLLAIIRMANVTVQPIRTETDYDAALAEIEAIFSAPPDTPEGDRLDVLTTLVEAYEERHYPITPPDPIAAIEFHMDRLGFSQRDLKPFIGGATAVSDILNRRRALTLPMIRALSEGLGIPTDILVQPYELVRKSA